MSYNIDLKFERGFTYLANVSGDVPEGMFTISGHKDGTSENLGIHRRNPDGTFAGSASHSHPVAPVPDPDEGF